jgi:CysZ protein
MFGQGLTILVRRPRLLLLGAVPAVLTALLLLGSMIALVVWIGDLSAWVTPFADDWSEGWRTTIRIAAGVAVFALALVIAQIAFSALTLAIGSPFYEHIAEKVEDDLGGVPDAVDLPWYTLLGMGIKDGIVLVLRSLMFTIPLFFLGFVPIVGQFVVPVLMVLVTGWFLAVELAGVAFYRRGMGLKERLGYLRKRRMLTLGLGVPASLLCLIPLAAIIVMPVAFVGGVLVARETLGVTRSSAQVR